MTTRLLHTNKEWVIYSIIFISFYLLNLFSPLAGDDYWYSVVMSDGYYKEIAYSPINNMEDVLESQAWAYMHHNGRFVVHCVVQLFCGIIGLRAFQFLNSLVLLLLVIGITRILRFKGNDQLLLDTFLPFILIFLAIPIIGRTYLGNISCAVNYLWTSCAVVWYLFFLFSKRTVSRTQAVFLFLFSVLVGSLQESFSIGIACMLFIYLLVHHSNLERISKILIVGFIVGSVIVVCAPANFIRFNYTNDASLGFSSKIWQCVRVALSLRLFWLMLLMIAWRILAKRSLKSISSEYWWAVGICVIHVIFAGVVAMTGKHQLTSVELFSMLVIICLLYDKYYTWISVHSEKCLFALLSIYVILYFPVFVIRKAANEGHQAFMESAQMTTTGEVIHPGYKYNLDSYDNWLVKRFVLLEDYYDIWIKNGLSLYLTKGENLHYIASVLPDHKSAIISMCNSENNISYGVYKDEQYPFYIVTIPTSQKDELQCSVEMRPGVVGRLLYSLVRGDEKKIDKRVYDFNTFNNFEVDDITYAIVTSSSPIQNVTIVYAQ